VHAGWRDPDRRGGGPAVPNFAGKSSDLTGIFSGRSQTSPDMVQ
jgi:hypothetical protein